MTGRIDIQLIVDAPQDTELVQPLDEAFIWRQARGAATEVSGMEDVPGSIDKVLVEGRGTFFNEVVWFCSFHQQEVHFQPGFLLQGNV